MSDSNTPLKHIRDEVEPQYALIPLSVLRRIAMVFAEGAEHYSPRGWEEGMSYTSVVNHMMEHLTKYWEGYRDEDHLAKAAFGLIALMFYDDRQYENDWCDMSPPATIESTIAAAAKNLQEAFRNFR